MMIPNGMTENEVLKCIDRVAEILASTFGRRFPDMAPDDVRQEVRLHCWQCLQRGGYDPSRPLQALLLTDARNRLLNRLRDKVRRTDPPCKKCAAGTPCGPNVCRAYARWEERQRSKTNIVAAISLDVTNDVGEPQTKARDETEDVAAEELLEIIDEELPLDLRAAYLRMRAGESVSKPVRQRVQQAVLAIVQAYRTAEDLGLPSCAQATAFSREVPPLSELVAANGPPDDEAV